MNSKIFRYLKLKAELSADDLKQAESLASMTETDKQALIEFLGGKAKASKPTTKKFKKCNVCGVSKRAAHHRDVNHPDYHVFDEGTPKTTGQKSARANDMAAQLNKSLQSQQRVTKPVLCSYAIDGKVCHGEESDSIHDKSLGYLNYHPFVSSSTARNAVGQSSTSEDEASSEAATANASIAMEG